MGNNMQRSNTPKIAPMHTTITTTGKRKSKNIKIIPHKLKQLDVNKANFSLKVDSGVPCAASADGTKQQHET